MKNTLVKAAIMSLVLALAACGGEATEVSVDSEEAGDNCEAGGVKVTIDGEDHYVCDGDDGSDGEDGADGVDGESPHITTANVEAGEGDNPCEYSAIEVTVENPDGSTIVDYLCQPPEPNDFFQSVLDAQMTIQTLSITFDCECTLDDQGYASVDECVDDLSLPYSEIQYQRACIGDAYEAYDREAPTGLDDLETCYADSVVSFETCIGDIEESDQCSQAGDTQISDCQTTLNDAQDQCLVDNMDEESQVWFDDFSDFIEIYCPGI